jgi:hypothetical protein
MKLKKIELTVKNFILKIYFLRKIYLFLKIVKKSKNRYNYGENSEDALINSFFSKKKHGTYLDVGCYHPIRGSLTYSLYKKGWSGTNIDLSKETIDLFNICRPNDLNLNIGISDKNSDSEYFQVGHINQANSLKRIRGTTKIKIKTINLTYLIKKYQIKKIDYLNIDGEAFDYKIISGLNFKKIRPNLITIEDANDNDYDIKNLLRNKINNLFYYNNYFLYSRTYCTSFYIDNKYKNMIPKLLDTTLDFSFD